jgi:hypothetical protein
LLLGSAAGLVAVTAARTREVLASGTELFACEYLVTGRMTGNGGSMNGASA